MPELQIIEDGRLKRLASVEVLSVMAYPKASDEVRRKQFLTSMDARVITHRLDRGLRPEVLPKEWRAGLERKALEVLPLVTKAPSIERQQQAMGSMARHAWVAGNVLRYLLAGSEHHPQVDVNIDKVLGVLGQRYEASPSPGPRPVGREETVRKYWKRFRSVSHLHLSFNYLSALVLGVPDDYRWDGGQRAKLLDKDLLSVLALAERLRKAAEERGFFRRTNAWVVPDVLELPPAEFEIGKIFNALPAAVVEALQAHVARHAGRSAPSALI